MLVLMSLGCENQQPIIDSLNKEKADIAQQLTKAKEQASQMATENTALQQGLDAAQKTARDVQDAAKQAKTAAKEALASAKKQVADAMAAAQIAQTTGAQALADAKKQAAAAVDKAVADAKVQMARADQAAAAKVDQLQKQLDGAKAKIAELEAAAKKSAEPSGK